MARILVKKPSGVPRVKMRVQGPRREFRNPILRKRSIRTLIKQDESKGRTLPSFSGITDAKGVVTSNGAFSTSVRTMLQRPFVKPGTRTRPGKIISPPPLAIGGIKRRKNGV